MKHLCREQIDMLVAGESIAGAVQHLNTCPACAAEFERLRDTLFSFGHSVRNWADQEDRETVPILAVPKARRRFTVAWALATAALVIILAAVPLYKNANERRRELQAREDSLLLEQVNRHISRAVPAPMEPFMDLLTVGPVEETGGRR